MSTSQVATSQSEPVIDSNQVQKQEDIPATPYYEIRVSKKVAIGRLIHECVDKVKDKANSNTVKISGLGMVIPKVIEIAEGVKRQVGFLHQVNDITYHEFSDSEESKESEKKVRNVEMITIYLSKNALDKTAVGYQKPAPL